MLLSVLFPNGITVRYDVRAPQKSKILSVVQNGNMLAYKFTNFRRESTRL